MSIPTPQEPKTTSGPLERVEPSKPKPGSEWELYKVENGKFFYRNKAGQIMVQ